MPQLRAGSEIFRSGTNLPGSVARLPGAGRTFRPRQIFADRGKFRRYLRKSCRTDTSLVGISGTSVGPIQVSSVSPEVLPERRKSRRYRREFRWYRREFWRTDADSVRTDESSVGPTGDFVVRPGISAIRGKSCWSAMTSGDSGGILTTAISSMHDGRPCQPNGPPGTPSKDGEAADPAAARMVDRGRDGQRRRGVGVGMRHRSISSRDRRKHRDHCRRHLHGDAPRPHWSSVDPNDIRRVRFLRGQSRR